MKESYYARNAAKVKARASAYYHKNAGKRKQDFRLRELALKREIVEHYTAGINKCCLCLESRLGALHVDHVDGGGKAHRLSINKKGGGAFYNWLKRNRFPAGYRILCANCNWLEHLRLSSHKLSASEAAIKARHRAGRYKLIVLEKLGDRCRCGADDRRILTVHHIDGDGSEHRRLISNGKSGGPFYRGLVSSDRYDGLEILCFSCNDAEAYER